MNYRHAYHAGNFADVLKHAILTRILLYLMRKDAPLAYLDTHAGIGRYDLRSDEALRTGEWRDGIGRILKAERPPQIEALLEPWLRLVDGEAQADELASYPGSPALAAGLLRARDRLLLCELHEADFRSLRNAFGRDKRIKPVHIDGYTALKAWLPPKEKRGLVLIDPPFEDRDEFRQLAGAATTAWRKWPGGCYALWYPVKDPAHCDLLFESLNAGGVRHVLRAELAVAAPQTSPKLAASGLAIINPPFVLADELNILGPWLRDQLAQDAGAHWRLETAIGE